MAERRNFQEDVASVERGLRRLRDRGNKDGGVWGQRALRCFGLPVEVDDRVRWMGQYHTRFSHLPAPLNLLAACSAGPAVQQAKQRARGIARQLEDEALLVRFGPTRWSPTR
ncbi:hypothetical protein DB30_00902 [Enhygromyxa salina]|uniref:Uncharacterized protein n=1 Tax=Enhygromyxa salina TaxID=215803 RepID=A0A0C2CNY6_9BACT|nr:hypothetical protein [Enhygromyxa salina]KIG12946.1 hypothetical protein DB30_00902 [Enhygromyxa salina]